MIARLECSNIRELPDLNRTGHTCANLDGELLFLWGASSEPAGTSAPETRDSHLWMLDTLSGYWRHRNCSGECPPYLSGASSTLIGQKMYLFGGHSSAHDNWLNSLYCLDLSTFVWRDLGSQALADPSKPVRSDKCSAWSFAGCLYVFGGYGWSQLEHLLHLLDRQKDFQLAPDYRWPKFGWNNQLVSFNPRTNTWSWPSYTGKCPSARAAHSGALLADKYYVFGGRDSHQRLNDLYVLDMNTLHWTQLAEHIDLGAPVLEPIAHPGEFDEPANDPELERRAQAAPAAADGGADPSPSGSSQQQYDQQQEDEEEEELSSASSVSSRSEAGTFYQPLASASTDDTDYEDDAYENFNPGARYAGDLLGSGSAGGSSQVDGANCTSMHHHGSPPAQMLSSDHQQYSGASSDPQQVSSRQQATQDSSATGNQDQSRRVSTSLSNQHLEAPRPVGRSFATLTPISHKDLLLYGGISSQDKSLDEIWLFDTQRHSWMPVESKMKQARLWHTAARSRNNEILVVGGSSSTKVHEFCSDVIAISLEPKSLKRLALDSTARSIQMRNIQRIKQIPGPIYKLIKLRKQAIALTMRRIQSSRHQLAQASSSARIAV